MRAIEFLDGRRSPVPKDDPFERTPLELVTELQDGLLSRATGGDFPAEFGSSDSTYQWLRRQLIEMDGVDGLKPEFVRRCRDLNQFWQFIKHHRASYAERREFLWESFRPLIEHLELGERSPSACPVGEALQHLDADSVQDIWQKALSRRSTDPEGAITAAKSLLESVCKHALEDMSVLYAPDADLPKLWALCAEKLNLMPQQHEEKIFKSILGSCQAVVNGLGSLRNKMGDAHGGGRRAVRPHARHAELAVNLAGAMSAFLVSTLEQTRSAIRESD